MKQAAAPEQQSNGKAASGLLRVGVVYLRQFPIAGRPETTSRLLNTANQTMYWGKKLRSGTPKAFSTHSESWRMTESFLSFTASDRLTPC